MICISKHKINLLTPDSSLSLEAPSWLPALSRQQTPLLAEFQRLFPRFGGRSRLNFRKHFWPHHKQLRPPSFHSGSALMLWSLIWRPRGLEMRLGALRRAEIGFGLLIGAWGGTLGASGPGRLNLSWLEVEGWRARLSGGAGGISSRRVSRCEAMRSIVVQVAPA